MQTQRTALTINDPLFRDDGVHFSIPGLSWNLLHDLRLVCYCDASGDISKLTQEPVIHPFAPTQPVSSRIERYARDNNEKMLALFVAQRSSGYRLQNAVGPGLELREGFNPDQLEMSGFRPPGVKDAFAELKSVVPNSRGVDFVPDRTVKRNGRTGSVKIETDRSLLDQPVPKLDVCSRKRIPPPKELGPKGVLLVAHWNFQGRVPKGGVKGQVN
jgi:hypothetical protein